MPLMYAFAADTITLDRCQAHPAVADSCTLRTVLLAACRHVADPATGGKDPAEREQAGALLRLLCCPGLVLLSVDEISALGGFLLIAGEDAEERADCPDAELRALASHWNRASQVLAVPLNTGGGAALDHGIFAVHSDT